MVDENVRRSKSNAPEDSGVNFLQRMVVVQFGSP